MRRYRNNGKGEIELMDTDNNKKIKVRPDKEISPDDYKTAEGLLQAIAEEIANIKLIPNIEPVTKAKVVSNLVRTGIKVYEVSDLVKRVEEIEKIANTNL